VREVATSRRFCRFTRGSDPFSLHEIPESGFCLSTFLLVRPANDRGRILVGRLDPNAPWDHLGGLSSERVEAHRHGWHLPSSQLLLRESPDESAARILDEQLTGFPVELEPPVIDSEVYTPRRWPDAPNHWDLRFVYLGTARRTTLPPLGPWSRLEWLELRSAHLTDFARSHEDVLLRAGLKIGTS
jgi:hypothetical protein